MPNTTTSTTANGTSDASQPGQIQAESVWGEEPETVCESLQGIRGDHKEEIPLPERQPQRERDTQPTEGQMKLASACRGHGFSSYPSSVVSMLQGARHVSVSSTPWGRINGSVSACAMTSTTIACFRERPFSADAWQYALLPAAAQAVSACSQQF